MDISNTNEETGKLKTGKKNYRSTQTLSFRKTQYLFP